VRTILRGRILRVQSNDSPLAFVTLELRGGDKLVAAITRLAFDELGLAADAEVYALVKSVALDERAL
jgi:molybdate transport system ATP-binding protein